MQLIFLIGLVWHHPSEDSGSLLHRHISVPSNGINDVCLSTEQQSGWMRSSNSHQSSIKISEVFAKGFPVNLLSTSSGLLGISQFLRFQNHIRSWKLGIAATGFLGWDGGDLHQLLRERCHQLQTASFKLPISAHSLRQVRQVQDSWIINLACSYADLWPGVPA
jgi:hypothetical protein